MRIQKATYNCLKSRLNIFLLLIILLTCNLLSAHATVYFYADAEDGTVGNDLPNPPFCQTECSGSGSKGTYQESGGAPQGLKYFQWQTVANQSDAYTVIHNTQGLPINNTIGKTYYLAYYMNFSRINGLDIWYTADQSADKGVEILGSGVRWVTGRGSWESFTGLQSHRFTVWGGNPTYHLNPGIEIVGTYVQNSSGYSRTNPIQLQYERWYRVVTVIKMASDNTGFLAIYIDGVKILEYTNIRTAANSSPTIVDITMGGTIAQPAYDAPAHYRKFDRLLLTDSWQDIINGGYLKKPSPPFLHPIN